jgi:hypothetical protein
MKTIEELQGLLADYNLYRVAKSVNLNPNCLYRLMKNKTSYKTVETLSKYFEQKELNNGESE